MLCVQVCCFIPFASNVHGRETAVFATSLLRLLLQRCPCSIDCQNLQHSVPYHSLPRVTPRRVWSVQRSGLNRLYPQYRFFFEGKGRQLMMIAQKCSKNRTSNYHVFDMQRGGFGTVSRGQGPGTTHGNVMPNSISCVLSLTLNRKDVL